MAQKGKKQIKQRRKTGPKSTLPFTDKNYKLFGLGLIVIILGYISLSIGPVDSFWSLTLAPILLTIGYLIVIPYAILYQEKKNIQKPGTPSTQESKSSS